MRRINLLLFSLILVCSAAKARTGAACANGNWGDPNTWLFSGMHYVPDCGDTISISSSYTVTVNAQTDMSSCGSGLRVTVGGILQFTNGNKLSLNCSSIIYVLSGGTIKKSGAGGGNSTNITICSTIEWKAGDGPLSGPAVLGDITLPVTLLYIDAKQEEDKIKISWATASEINNDYFNVERSTDGKQFSSIEKVRGAGNSTVTNDYSCVDNKPYVGVSYYRLKQTDNDGRVNYSDITAVNYKGKQDIEIHAVSGNLDSNVFVLFSSSEYKMCTLNIIDMSGATVYQEDLLAEKGSNNKIFSTASLSAGNYILSLTGSGSTVRKLFAIK